MSQTFFAGVLHFSLEMYDLQLSLFDCLMVRRAFALVILIAVNFDSKGLQVKSLTACFLLAIANLQSSLNQDLCLGLSLPLVLGIDSFAILIRISVNSLNLLFDLVQRSWVEFAGTEVLKCGPVRFV
jgi:hypothetical protein